MAGREGLVAKQDRGAGGEEEAEGEGEPQVGSD